MGLKQTAAVVWKSSVKKSITTPFGEYRVVTEVPLAERGKKEDVSFPACAAFWVRRWTVRLRSSAPYLGQVESKRVEKESEALRS